MKALLSIILGLIIGAQPVLATGQANQFSLVVHVHGALPGKGQIIATLFDAESTYMKTPAAERSALVDGSGSSDIMFLITELGDYSVSVFHDLDLDGQLDTGLFGIPKEKIGFSNNARGKMGPAPWSKTRFEVSKNPTVIEILLGKAK